MKLDQSMVGKRVVAFGEEKIVVGIDGDWIWMKGVNGVYSTEINSTEIYIGKESAKTKLPSERIGELMQGKPTGAQFVGNTTTEQAIIQYLDEDFARARGRKS